MGAYLSEPKTEKLSEDEENEFIKYGASSMQGWRTSQEDAHIGLLDFDEKTSVFAVFDGHGGGEVAKYCALHLPQFLKNIKHYKEGNFNKALEEAFIEFDSLLIKSEVIEELKVIAGDDYIRSDEDEDDEHEASLLKEEAKLPLEALIARYSGQENDPNEVVKRDHIPPHVRLEMNSSKRNKPISPFLRGKQGPSTSTHDDSKASSSLCSSSSSTNESEAVNRFEPCSSSSSTSGSSSSSNPLPNGKLSESDSSADPETKPTFHTKHQSDGGDPVSSSVNEMIEDKNEICKVSSTKSEPSKLSSNLISESSEVALGEPSTGEVESNKLANGETGASGEKETCVSTSSEATPAISESSKSNQLTSSTSQAQASAACDNTVSAAASTSADEPSSSSKGKGKKKKVVIPVNETDVRAALVNQVKLLENLGNDEGWMESDDDSDYDSSDMDDDDDEEEEEEDDDDDDDDDEDEDENENDGQIGFPSTTDFEIPGRDSGCTAVFALLKGNRLYVANAGDSRCVVSRKGKALEMSLDHKPEDAIERARIEAAGGSINADGRVNGGLNLSRAIGDHGYKTNSELSLKEQMITAFPDIRTAIIKPDRDEFMVLACDGIWNSLSSQEVIDFVRERLDDKRSLSSICEELFHHCLSPDTEGDGTGCDNMTCIIVKFTNVKPTDSQKELSDSDDEVIKTNEEQQPCPSQSDSKKKQPAPESKEGSSSSEPSTKRQKTDL